MKRSTKALDVVIRFKAKTDAQETSVLTLEDYLDVPLEQEQTNLQTHATQSYFSSNFRHEIFHSVFPTTPPLF